MKLIFFPNLRIKRIAVPQLWFGIGVGSAVGVVAAAGLEMSAADGARFLGALLGSLIAVGGAISLYYLKEKDEINKSRRHILKLAEDGRRQALNCGIYIEKLDFKELAPALLALGLIVKRARRFMERFEFGDELISEAAVVMDETFEEELKLYSQKDVSEKDLNFLSSAVVFHLKGFNTIISVLKGEQGLRPLDAAAAIEVQKEGET